MTSRDPHAPNDRQAVAGGGAPRRPGRPGLVADARGRPVRVADPAARLLGRHDDLDHATLDAVMRDLADARIANLRTIRIGIAAVLVLLGAAIALVAISVALEGAAALADLRASLVLTGPAVATMVGAGVLAPALVARRRRLAGARDAWLRHGRCPGCTHRIAEVPPAEGLLTCPECGAAWPAVPAP